MDRPFTEFVAKLFVDPARKSHGAQHDTNKASVCGDSASKLGRKHKFHRNTGTLSSMNCE